MYNVVLSVDDNDKTAEATAKATVSFVDEIDVFNKSSEDNNLLIDKNVPDAEKSENKEHGGEVPLCDQDGFQCTPPCSQIPQVNPYARKRQSYR